MNATYYLDFMQRRSYSPTGGGLKLFNRRTPYPKKYFLYLLLNIEILIPFQKNYFSRNFIRSKNNRNYLNFVGWEYCIEATGGGWGSVFRSYHFCRRRRWVRTRNLEQDPQKLMKKQKEKAKQGEGWEYAPVFGMKYHLKEHKFDVVRRRRWHRKMVNVTPGALPTFKIEDDDEKGKFHQIMPRIFLAYDSKKFLYLNA